MAKSDLERSMAKFSKAWDINRVKLLNRPRRCRSHRTTVVLKYWLGDREGLRVS